MFSFHQRLSRLLTYHLNHKQEHNSSQDPAGEEEGQGQAWREQEQVGRDLQHHVFISEPSSVF